MTTITSPTADVQVNVKSASVLTRFWRALFAPIDIGMLVVFRVAFGASMLIEVYRYFAPGSDGITRIQRTYIDPQVHFTFFGFPWVQPFPGDGMYILFGVLGVAALLITIGLLYRLAALTFFLGFTYVFLLEQAVYLNHFYLISLVSGICVLLPANRAWSVDALLRPSLHSWTVPAWTLWLLRFQIGVAYFYGGIAKMNADWITGVPMYLMMASRTDFPILGQFFHETWAIYIYAWGGLLFDLLIVPALLWHRTRVPAYLAAVLFHTSNAKMFNIGIFPLVMVAVTIIFFPPETLRSDKRKDEPAPDNDRPIRLTRWQKVVATVVLLHVAGQLLIPFRHFLYPGDVSWTEEGHRFAWHMKLRSKSPAAMIMAVDGTGRPLDWRTPELILAPQQRVEIANRADAQELMAGYAERVRAHLEAQGHEDVQVFVERALFLAVDGEGRPLDWRSPTLSLTDRQADKMAGQPDMLLQYAHWIRDHLEAQGHQSVRVYVYADSSLNGRDPQSLIDPRVDLAAQPRNLRSSDWIVPLEQPLPKLSDLQARFQSAPSE